MLAWGGEFLCLVCHLSHLLSSYLLLFAFTMTWYSHFASIMKIQNHNCIFVFSYLFSLATLKKKKKKKKVHKKIFYFIGL